MYLPFIPVQHCTDDTQNCDRNLSQLKFPRLKLGNARRYCWVGTSLTHPDSSFSPEATACTEGNDTEECPRTSWHSFCPQYRLDVCQECGLACAVPYPAKEMLSRKALLDMGQIWSRVCVVAGMNNRSVHPSNFVISALTSVCSLKLIYQFKFSFFTCKVSTLCWPSFFMHSFYP